MNPSTATANSESAILGRLFEPDRRELTPDAARYILCLSFPQHDRDRMNALAESAREGNLSPTEEVELENYRHVGHLLGLMQSKARLALNKPAKGH